MVAVDTQIVGVCHLIQNHEHSRKRLPVSRRSNAMKPKKRTYEIRAVVEDENFLKRWQSIEEIKSGVVNGIAETLCVKIKSIRVSELKARKP